MTTWTSDELHKIGAAAELELLTLLSTGGFTIGGAGDP